MIEHDRSQVLQHLHRRLDPFQKGSESERIRAFGLINFYQKMVDPSLEYLEEVSAGLINIPRNNLEELKFATYDVGKDPRQFFTNYGIAVDELEELQVGIDHSIELIDRIAIYRFDYESSEVHWCEEISPKAFAESVHEGIQISNGERQIEKMIEQVQNESDFRTRHLMGLSLKEQVLDYISRFSFTFYPYNAQMPPVEPTWENLTKYTDLIIELQTQDGSNKSGFFGFKKAINVAQAAITRYPFEQRLKQLPTRDQELFEELRLKYGAKAANLIILSELVSNINRLRDNRYDVHLIVPGFQAVPVDLYRAWQEGKFLDDDLRPYFEWASGLSEADRWYHSGKQAKADYLVRSSAVFSEDGENTTGAGIYESVKISAGGTFEEFKDAVTSVYASTDSPQARAYRAQHGIDKEEMGLVIQKYIFPGSGIDGQSQGGYVNSKLPGVPQLMEIATGTSRNFIRRQQLDFFLALDADRNEGAFRAIHHFPPDQDKIDRKLPVRVAQLTSVLERIWGRDVQVEFIADNAIIYFVQVRPLPNLMLQAPEVQFPDKTPVHSGASIGAGDMELYILDSYDDNSEEAGAVVFRSNHMFSIRNNSDRLPKEGAVIICTEAGVNGHIQTLCVEKGIICVFPDVNKEDNLSLSYEDLSRLTKVRIVSNGIEARVYESKR